MSEACHVEGLIPVWAKHTVGILLFMSKNVNVTTVMFLMSGDLTGLCLYMNEEKYKGK